MELLAECNKYIPSPPAVGTESCALTKGQVACDCIHKREGLALLLPATSCRFADLTSRVHLTGLLCLLCLLRLLRLPLLHILVPILSSAAVSITITAAARLLWPRGCLLLPLLLLGCPCSCWPTSLLRCC